MIKEILDTIGFYIAAGIMILSYIAPFFVGG